MLIFPGNVDFEGRTAIILDLFVHSVAKRTHLLSFCCQNSFCYGADHGNDTASWVPQNPSTYRYVDTPQDFGTPIPCLVLHGSAPRDEVVLATETYPLQAT